MGAQIKLVLFPAYFIFESPFLLLFELYFQAESVADVVWLWRLLAEWGCSIVVVIVLLNAQFKLIGVLVIIIPFPDKVRTVDFLLHVFVFPPLIQRQKGSQRGGEWPILGI